MNKINFTGAKWTCIDGSMNPIDRDPTNSICIVNQNRGVFNKGIIDNVDEVWTVLLLLMISARLAEGSISGKMKNEITNTKNSNPPMKKNGRRNPPISNKKPPSIGPT